MTYKIGTRVKKVRGLNAGVTAIVCAGPTATGYTLEQSERGADMYVCADQSVETYKGNVFRAGLVTMSNSRDWTPIQPDGHRAGVKGECSLLDELLSRENNNETVK